MENARIHIFAVLLLSVTMKTGYALTCTDPEIKVTVKIEDPTQFDEYEQFLFKGLMAYTVRRYCGLIDRINTECVAAPALINTLTSNVIISNVTNRFAMCVQVEDCSAILLQDAIKETKPRFNGALVLTDNTLVVDGVPIILQEATQPDFPTWLIPYIVFMGLVVIAAVVIIGYTVYQSKKGKKSQPEDNQSLTASIYENGYKDNEPKFTMM